MPPPLFLSINLTLRIVESEERGGKVALTRANHPQCSPSLTERSKSSYQRPRGDSFWCNSNKNRGCSSSKMLRAIISGPDKIIMFPHLSLRTVAVRSLSITKTLPTRIISTIRTPWTQTTQFFAVPAHTQVAMVFFYSTTWVVTLISPV